MINNVDLIYLDLAKHLIKLTTAYYCTNSKKVTINGKIGVWKQFYIKQTTMCLLSMEQHQVKLKSEVAYPKDSVRASAIPNTYI